MSIGRFAPEFKEEAVRQIIDRGYPVSEAAELLGVSVHSLINGSVVTSDKSQEQAAGLVSAQSEIFKFWLWLCRAEEENDIQKRPLGTFLGRSN